MPTRNIALNVLWFCVLALSVVAQQPTGERTSQPRVTSAGDAGEADQLNGSVVTLYRQGKYDEALPLAQKVLQLKEQESGVGGVPTANALSNLGAIHFAKKDYDASKSTLERALKIYESNIAGSESAAAAAYETLALIATSRQDYGRAESHYERVITLRQGALGQTHPSLGLPLLKLAELVQYRGDTKRARELYGRSLDAYDALPKPVPNNVVEILESHLCKMMDTTGTDGRSDLHSRLNRIIADPPKPDIEPDTVTKRVIVRGGVLNGRAIKRVAPE